MDATPLPDTKPSAVQLQDYVILSQAPAPADYPFGPVPDEYSTEPFAASFDQRRRALFEFIRNNPAPTNLKAPWHELGRLAAGSAPHTGIFFAALDYIDARRDGADIPLHGILRLLYQYSQHLRLPPELLEKAQASLLSFKYWPDEPGQDSMCTWTESHYILFAGAAYLAGQLYPDQVFGNTGETGKEKVERFQERVLRWMNLRFITGFSEWLSPLQYDEALTALLSLADFAKDPQIHRKACMLLDLLLYEMAVHNFYGVFASTHGSVDETAKKQAAQESSTDTQKLLFGRGIFAGVDNMSAVAFALSPRYRMPQVIYDIANDQARPELLHRQRMGIQIDQAGWWDLQPDNMENGMLLLNLEAYLHPRTANLFVKMLDEYNWWENSYFKQYKERRNWLKTLRLSGTLPLMCRRYQQDVNRSTREEVNIYTYRTPDYQLSSAVDYRKGFGGDQQHIWQATLGPDAVCFTTHPARQHGDLPNYWMGSGCLPRVAQVKNVLIAIYRLEKYPALFSPIELFLTHAWLPRDKFEEMVEQDGWIFARSGDGYLALLSENPYEWQSHPGEDQHREVIVTGKHNTWICELGRKAVDGSFGDFMQRILEAEVLFSGDKVSYQSPSQGHLVFSWKEALQREGQVIPLGDYPRYASPYALGEFPLEKIDIQLGEQALHLNWLDDERTATDTV